MNQSNFLDVSFYHIELFLTLARTRSFSRAAELLFIAQPTLTRRIKVLEETIGLELFLRDKRPLELTAAGEYLYNEWSSLISRFEKDLNNARTLSHSRKNRLTVGAMDSARRLTPMETTERELRTVSDITITTEYVPINNWLYYVQNGSIDIMTALSFELPYIDDSLEYETLYTCPLLACMLKTNPLASRKSIELSDLKDQDFIFNSPQTFPSYCKYYSHLCYESGFGPRITKYVSSPHSLIWNIQNDNEVLLCDLFIRDIESPQIAKVEIRGQESSLMAIWKKGNDNPLIQMYVNMLKKEFRTYRPEQDMIQRGY
ncbi:MAG: LysR family transcriptional regulator [Parasporobacterium sp.]|nr:LysR family transcriptional regulator [Parasporobacterium sp.]